MPAAGEVLAPGVAVTVGCALAVGGAVWVGLAVGDGEGGVTVWPGVEVAGVEVAGVEVAGAIVGVCAGVCTGAAEGVGTVGPAQAATSTTKAASQGDLRVTRGVMPATLIAERIRSGKDKV